MAHPNSDAALAEALRALVSDRAAILYTELLDGDGAGAGRGRSGCVHDAALDELVRSGLVGVVADTGEPFVQPPRLALARAVQNATRAWLATAPDIHALTTLLEAAGPATVADPTGPAEVDDPAERQRAMEALVLGAVDELAVLQPYDATMDDDEADRWTSQPDAVTPARVTCRTVYEERLFEVANFGHAIHQEVSLGAQIRITRNPLPGFLLVVDRRAAAYSPAPDRPGRITTESSLVAMLHMAFEAAWAAATPLLHDGQLSDDQQTVLTLVGLGHTNRQIGGMLGLHERTIRRRVSDLLDHFGEIERAALIRHAHTTPNG